MLKTNKDFLNVWRQWRHCNCVYSDANNKQSYLKLFRQWWHWNCDDSDAEKKQSYLKLCWQWRHWNCDDSDTIKTVYDSDAEKSKAFSYGADSDAEKETKLSESVTVVTLLRKGQQAGKHPDIWQNQYKASLLDRGGFL